MTAPNDSENRNNNAADKDEVRQDLSLEKGETVSDKAGKRHALNDAELKETADFFLSYNRKSYQKLAE